MDELDDGLKISVTGALRERALAECARQLAVWNVSMPPVEPLVLDFGLGDFYKTGRNRYRFRSRRQALEGL